MIENFNLLLLSGGHHCDRSWSRKATGTDRCCKVYFPVSGTATPHMGSDSFTLQAGRVYLISGYRLTRQHCAEAMDVFWVHFVPESLYLQHLLDQAAPVFHCLRPSATGTVLRSVRAGFFSWRRPAGQEPGMAVPGAGLIPWWLGWWFQTAE